MSGDTQNLACVRLKGEGHTQAADHLAVQIGSGVIADPFGEKSGGIETDLLAQGIAESGAEFIVMPCLLYTSPSPRD